MVSSSDVHRASQYCMDMHNFYINNHKMLDSIVVDFITVALIQVILALTCS
jgi:hypothetical protein